MDGDGSDAALRAVQGELPSSMEGVQRRAAYGRRQHAGGMGDFSATCAPATTSWTGSSRRTACARAAEQVAFEMDGARDWVEESVRGFHPTIMSCGAASGAAA